MLTAIEVGKGWSRYAGSVRSDDDPPVEPGTYYLVGIRKPEEKLKRSLGLMAVRNPRGSFMWIALNEPWVKRVMDGCFNYSVFRGTPDWSVVGIDPAKLRAWQKEFVCQAWGSLERGLAFRRVGHVSLGGGKTLAGLCLLALGEAGLVVCPKHVQETWSSEATKFGFQKPQCTTYESCHKFLDASPDVVICDEIHMTKSAEALRHAHAAALCKQAQIAVGFTASLIGGRGPLDLQSLRVIAPGCFPSEDTPVRFLFGLDTKLEEVAPGRKAYVTKTWDTKKIAEFILPWVETVDTSALLAELPPLTERIVTLPTPKDYGLVSKGASTRSASKRVAQCRQCSDGFVEMDDGSIVALSNEKAKWIANEVEFLGEPVVIYAAWRESVNALAKLLEAYLPSVLEGGSGDAGFQVERFKTGQTRVLIANAAYSAGMNLQEVCRVMIFMSLSLNPTNYQQSIGRIYRPGQTKGCQIIHLQCEGTMDQRACFLVKNHLELSEEQVEALLSQEDS